MTGFPVFWDDMPLKEGGVYESTWSDEVTSEEAVKAWKEGTPKLDSLLSDFPKNCVYMRWNYSMARQPGNIIALDWYQSRGLKAMIATATNDRRRNALSSRMNAIKDGFVGDQYHQKFYTAGSRKKYQRDALYCMG